MNKHYMHPERLWTLLARKLAGEATENELSELGNLLSADPELHFTIESFYTLWHVRKKQEEKTDTKNCWKAYES